MNTWSIGARLSAGLILGTSVLAACGLESTSKPESSASGLERPQVEPELPGSLVALVNASTTQEGLAVSRICAGVLVTASAALTAGHCVQTGRQPTSYKVIVGDPHLCDDVASGESRVVRSVDVHPKADLALLVLKRSIHSVAPTRTSSSGTVRSFAAFGWGRSGTPGATVCDATSADLVDAERQCGGSQAELCLAAAPEAHRILCVGDSGNPVLDEVGDLVAIASRTTGCAPEAITVHVDVRNLQDWIEGTLAARN